MSRPSSYTIELGEEIAARSAEGASLRTICEDESMPSLRQIQRWRNQHPEFDHLLLRAHLDKASILFEQSVDISDEPVADTAQAMRQKLRVQARQFAAARLDPARYAEKIGIGGARELPPLHHDRQLDWDSRTDRNELARRLNYAWQLGVREMERSQPDANKMEKFLELAAVIKQGLDKVREQGGRPEEVPVERLIPLPRPQPPVVHEAPVQAFVDDTPAPDTSHDPLKDRVDSTDSTLSWNADEQGMPNPWKSRPVRRGTRH